MRITMLADDRAFHVAHLQARPQPVAAPVLGRPDEALAGQLAIVAVALAETLVRRETLLDAIGRRAFSGGSTLACRRGDQAAE